MDDESPSDEELLSVEVTQEAVNSVESPYATKVFATLLLDGEPMRFQVDSGATCNVISKLDLPADTRIRDTNVRLKMYDNSSITALGVATIRLVNPKNSKRYRGEFVIVPNRRVPLLGSRAAQQMKFLKVLHENILAVEGDSVGPLQAGPRLTPLPGGTVNSGLTREDILEQYKDVFSGEVGLLAGEQKLDISYSR